MSTRTELLYGPEGVASLLKKCRILIAANEGDPLTKGLLQLCIATQELTELCLTMDKELEQTRKERDEARLNALSAIEETVATYEREIRWHARLAEKRAEAEGKVEELKSLMEDVLSCVDGRASSFTMNGRTFVCMEIAGGSHE